MNRLKLSWPLLLLTCFVPGLTGADGSDASLNLARQLNQAFIEVAEKVSPTVVVITVKQKATAPALEDEEPDGGFDSLPRGFWREFHKQFRQPQPETTGQGSGMIIRENGYILTNRHVVEDASTIQVRLKDGRLFKGVVRGVDPQSDVAVIKIDARGLPVATLADSTKTRVGEFAIAIGAPFSLDYSVTFGHVSAKGRTDILEGSEAGSSDQDFIQTDALINPGSSGGPLANIEGEVIGINTLIRGLHTGIGFAVPSALAKEVADEIIAEGKFTRAWLGVAINSLNEIPEVREFIHGIEEGVVVSGIMANGPASKSDLKPIDVITAVDGKRVSTSQQLRAAIRRKKIGQPVTLDVFRKGKSIQVKVSPGEWSDLSSSAVAAKSTPPRETGSTELGVSVQALTTELAGQLGVESIEGVVVTSVTKDSPAARKALRAGDIITSINQQPVASPAQFKEAIKHINLKKGVLLNLVSSKSARFEILKQGEP